MGSKLFVGLVVAAVIAASCSSGGDDGSDASSQTAATDPSGAETDQSSPPTDATGPVTTDVAVSDPPTTDATSTEPPSTDVSSTEPRSTDSAEPAALPDAYAGYSSETYADDAVWLCRGGVADDDVCLRDLDATAVFADGTTEPRPHEVATDPVADCFYVYPTVSQDPEANSDLIAAEGEEVNTVLNQAARLTGSCRVFAPIYRQVTLGGLFDADDEARSVAYDDVVDSFRHFIANDNDGRPFVLVGHSQGAGILNRLIEQEIDGEPLLADRMLSAILLGTSVAADGYDSIPPCAAAAEVNCVVSYSSYRNTAQPMPGAFFGSRDGTSALCVNPVDPEGGAAVSQPFFRVDAAGLLGGGAQPFDDDATVDTAISTPWVTYPDMVTVECVDDGTYGYLQLTITTADGPRSDDIGGDLTPEWGMHLVDANVAMGDLVELVRTQSDAFTG